MKQLGFARKIVAVNLVFVSTLTIAGIVFLRLNEGAFISADLVGPFIGWTSALGFAVIGMLIVRRYPRHLVGWLFCYLALPIVIAIFSAEFTYYGLVISPQPLSGAYFMAWVQSWVFFLVFPAALGLPYLYFPDSKLLSPHWRLIVLLAVVATILGVTGAMLNPGQMILGRFTGDIPLPITNVIGIEEQKATMQSFMELSWAGGFIVLLATMVSLVLRYRGSRGTQRLQLKWITYLLVMAVSGLFITELLIPADLSQIIIGLWIGIALLSIPVGVGIAILRYQLYDIDLIIKRTVLYASLTGSLTAIYFFSVIALQRVVPVQSQLSIVLSTLLIAFLFNPLKSRLQRFIDRRFFRQKYDPEQVLTEFGGSIRDEVDPETLSQELVAVVQTTLQPERVSLWVRDIDSL